jgi:hypothetical protein
MLAVVSIPFISPFYFVLFINIFHNISIPANCTYCREQINELTKTDVPSLAPHKNSIITNHATTGVSYAKKVLQVWDLYLENIMEL